jgi:hypothetical protein
MLHVLSAFAIAFWSYIVGRSIVFGFRSKKVIYWKPTFTSNTWYNLTPILLRLPDTMIKYSHAIVIMFSALYLFIVDHFPLHLTMICLTVSLHIFIPIFVIHTHSDTVLFAWALLNLTCIIVIIIGTVYLQFITVYLAVFALIPPTTISIWFTLIQIQLCSCIPIKFRGIEENRKPRII